MQHCCRRDTVNEPLVNFQEGQWWVAELDRAALTGADDFKRAVAVVHHMLRAAAGAELDTERLAFLYGGTKTGSNALVEAEMRRLNGEALTLCEARAAIDEAMQTPMPANVVSSEYGTVLIRDGLA